MPDTGCQNCMQPVTIMPTRQHTRNPMPRLVLLPQRLGPARVPTPHDLCPWRHRTRFMPRRPNLSRRFICTRSLPGRPILRRRENHHVPNRLLLRSRILPTNSLQLHLRRTLSSRRQRSDAMPRRELLPDARIQRLMHPAIILPTRLYDTTPLRARVLLLEYDNNPAMQRRNTVLDRHNEPATMPSKFLLPRPHRVPRVPPGPALPGKQHGSTGMRGKHVLPHTINPASVPIAHGIGPQRQLLPRLHLPPRHIRHNIQRHPRQLHAVPQGRRVHSERGKTKVRLLGVLP